MSAVATRTRALGLSTVLFLLLLPGGQARADRGGFVIRNFHTTLRVDAGAGLQVTERLLVEFSEPRHGIYRTIPVRYTDPRGYSYSLGFRLLEVVDEAGRRHQTKVSRQGSNVQIRIGSPRAKVRGQVTYLMRYSISRGLVHLAEHDELYWNATGNDWRTRIEDAGATIILPAPLEADDLEALGFTGRYGSRDRDVEISYPEPGVITYTATRSLAPLEGLTVVAAWPHGLVQFPGLLARTGRWLADNWIAAAPLAFLGLLWRTYRRRGRDPAGPGAVVVRYEPPAGISAAEMGALIDEKVHLHDITAAIVDLAVRGYLKIHVDKETGLFRMFGMVETTKVSFERDPHRSQEDLTAHERALLDALFEAGNWVDTDDLEEEFYQHIPGIRTRLYDRLVEQGYLAGNPARVRSRYVAYGIGAGLLTFGVGAATVWYRGGILPVGLVVPAVAAVATALVFMLFAPAMPRRTKKGVEMRSWGLGFQEFVKRVEAQRIEASERRGVFETLLPYAMALGVAAVWARKFEGIYTSGGPGWYTGSFTDGSFSTRSFQQSLTRAMTSAGRALQATPRSSGSSGAGGGGFSGGGGGGGGGGSW